MVVNTFEKIPQILRTADAMRKVRRAKQMFLLNWALETGHRADADARRGAALRPRKRASGDRNLF